MVAHNNNQGRDTVATLTDPQIKALMDIRDHVANYQEKKQILALIQNHKEGHQHDLRT